LRIVAGELKGRRLSTPPRRSATLRPTSDRVREAVFSILGDIEGARVLDLYCGTGALGIEAVSRGAAGAELVDTPYRLADRLEGELDSLIRNRLAPGARVVAEGSARRPLRLDLPLLVERRYGDTLVRIHGGSSS
jgi:16S rRNA (guanine966-N2)-methyltransferase